MRPPGTAAELERRRRLAVQRLQEGFSARTVAEFLGVHLRTVRRWWAGFRRRGDPGLDAKPQTGRPPKLRPHQVRQVLGWFRKNPKSFGFPTELWTARRVAQVIERKWDVRFNPRYLNAWLAARAITPQKPQRTAREADPSAIDRWRTADWPRLQNGHVASGPILSFWTKVVCC
jgi:transposase